MSEWTGIPPHDGWHWLMRRKDEALRAAFWDRISARWRLSDAIGRTSARSNLFVAKHYLHISPIEQPSESTTAEQ